MSLEIQSLSSQSLGILEKAWKLTLFDWEWCSEYNSFLQSVPDSPLSMRDRHFPCNYIKHRISLNISSNGEECTAVSGWPPRHCQHFWMQCLFLIVFCKPETFEFLREGAEWSQQAVGSLLLQIQMFIQSTKHRYKVSWRGGRHITSREVSRMAEFLMRWTKVSSHIYRFPKTAKGPLESYEPLWYVAPTMIFELYFFSFYKLNLIYWTS